MNNPVSSVDNPSGLTESVRFYVLFVKITIQLFSQDNCSVAKNCPHAVGHADR